MRVGVMPRLGRKSFGDLVAGAGQVGDAEAGRGGKVDGETARRLAGA